MKIISIRKGFTADHSSTSYEFLAIDRPLDAAAQAQVAKLSRRAEPTERSVSFIYHMDGYDIPGGWQPLMAHYYDLMISESYDWWTFALAFTAPKEQQEVIAAYAFDGVEDMGVRISTVEDRVIVEIHCQLDGEALYDLSTIPGRRRRGGGDPTEALFHLLSAIRQQLIAGDYRALYAAWEEYGYEENEDDEEFTVPPEPSAQETGQDVVKRFRGLLSTP
ncbi:MAG: hypothetical protein ACYC7E_13295 [Armatimonadota bacterium]